MIARKKIALIGGGNIGGTLSHIIRIRNLADVILLDRTIGTAQGKALDISECIGLNPGYSNITGTCEYSDIAGADVIIITAGVARKPGMSRDDLLHTNAEIIVNVAKNIKQYAPDAFVIVVTNPLDAMVYAFQKYSGLPYSKVVGMAGTLDTARFRFFLSAELGISVDDISTIILGGHGDSMVPLPRFTSVGGIQLLTLVEMGWLSQEKLNAIIERTKNGGGEIVKLLQTASAYYAPATSAIIMAESYIYDQRKILPCAAYLNGEYGVSNLYVGVPVVIGANGVEKIVELPLNSVEYTLFKQSTSEVSKLVTDFNNVFKD